MNHDIERVVEGLGFPEGPCFDADGVLYVTQMDEGAVSRIIDSTVEEYVNTGGKPNGAVFDRDGVLWIADAQLGTLIRYDGEQLTEIVSQWEGDPLQAPNDLVFHPNGSILMTGPGGSSERTPVGKLYHVQRDGALDISAGGIAFPNGLALTADARRLYVAETSAQRILVFSVDGDGNVGGPDVFAATPGGVGGDGVALDVEGNLYVAHFGTGRIKVFSPDGELLDALPAGGERPTNVAFGGEDMMDLYVTEVETGAVYRLRPGVAGLMPFHDPRGE